MKQKESKKVHSTFHVSLSPLLATGECEVNWANCCNKTWPLSVPHRNINSISHSKHLKIHVLFSLMESIHIKINILVNAAGKTFIVVYFSHRPMANACQQMQIFFCGFKIHCLKTNK
jgi:hypothetical protein